MSACNVNTLLSSGKAFRSLSKRDLQIVICQLLCEISSSGVTGGGPYVYASPSTTTPLNITRADTGKGIFELHEQVANSWHYVVGNNTNYDTVSDVDFYSSGTGFFRWTVALNAYVSWESSGDTIGGLKVRRSNAYDEIEVIRGDGVVCPSKVEPYFYASPAILVGAGAGAGGTVAASLVGANESDMSFRVKLRTGASGMAAGTLFTVTFDASNGLTPYTVAPHVIFSASDTNAAAASSAVYVDRAAVTTALFPFKCSAGLVANTDYYWDFFVCG